MLIERIWSANSYRNFHYLIACPETGQALAVDPLEWRFAGRGAQKGWENHADPNTHEHRDHTGGNAALVAATGARVLAHAAAAARIGGVDRGLSKGRLRVGRTVELECLDTPGHTMANICLLAVSRTRSVLRRHALQRGRGNCHNGGHPQSCRHIRHAARVPSR